MKIFLLVLTLTALHINLSAQSFSFNQGGFSDSDYFIELPYRDVQGKIIIEVELGNQKRNFILDTGAPTVISKSLFENLKLDVLASQNIADINGNKSVMKIAKVNELNLGASTIKDIPAVVLEENLFTKCFEVDGFIGSNLLRNSIIQFDYKNKLIRISSDLNKLNLTNAHSSELVLDRQSSPIFKIQIGEKATEMLLFDTGAEELYSISNSSMNKFKKTKTFNVISEGFGSSTIGINGLEEKSKNYRLMIPELSIQGLTLKNATSITISDGNSHIGSRLLEYGILTIDYKNSNSYFEQFPQTDSIKEIFWNINPTFIEGKLVVGRIWSNELKNIAFGDLILSINGKDMVSVSECDFLLKLPLLDIKVATLKIRNKKGEIQTIEIRKV